MARQYWNQRLEKRWTIVKDYITEQGDNCTDTWCILYGSETDAVASMERLKAGMDKTWFDPADNAFLYVTTIDIPV